MAEATIRRAIPADIDQIAKVHIRSWQEAYQGLIPQSYLDQLPSQLPQRIAMWNGTLANSERWVWVAEISGEVAGFVIFGPPRDPERDEYIEVGAIYLLAKHHGQGVGYSLLSTGFKFMSELGYKKPIVGF